MNKRTFKQFIARYLFVIIITLNLIFGTVLGIIVRNIQIQKEFEEIDYNITQAVNGIQNQINIDYFKVQTLAEIVASQINTPRAFYDFNSLFKHILSAESSINSVFIILSPTAVELDESLYPLLDTLNRYNVIWKKNASNIVFIDSLDKTENDFYFETVRNSGQMTVFKSTFSLEYVGAKFVKTIAFPIYEGSHFIGVIGFTLDYRFLNSTLVKNQLNEKMFITDEDGIIIYDRKREVSISKVFTYITNENFLSSQNDILRNKDFIRKSRGNVLIFTSFQANPLNVIWKIGVFYNSKDIYFIPNLLLFLIILGFIIGAFIIVVIFNSFFGKITSFMKIF